MPFSACRDLILPAALTLVLCPWAARATAEEVDRGALLKRSADGEDRFLRSVAEAEPEPSLGCRKVFASAMALCEARQRPEELAGLYELAARFQDRDPESPGYGNLRWYWRDERVTDRNAVEFCMQDALLTWLHHRDWMPDAARKRLGELMEYGIEGCMRHGVRTSYTNIALLNAANLIALGEAFDRPDVAEEGYRRLDLICLWTWRYGTTEYCSPTYYAVNLQGTLMIEAYAGRRRARRQAGALAELFWRDIGANWFAPAQRLAGAQSRSYDYLFGLGSLDRYLQVHGWIGEPIVPGPAMIHPLRLEWSPNRQWLDRAVADFPRVVRQSWGPSAAESRVHMLFDDVTLSTAAANYGGQDLPMTIDLAGDRQAVRCYFIPDGREDPYGKSKYPTGSAHHQKALHLKPFWTAAQRASDALGLVVYREGDLQEDVVINLQSHFVLRRTGDGIWIGGKPVRLAGAREEKPSTAPIAVGEPLVIRYGSAAVAIRVVMAEARDERPPSIALIDDANPYGAMRLTIDHDRREPTALAGAAFWVRVGSGLVDDSQFAAWRTAFEQSPVTRSEVTATGVRLEVPGTDGPVGLEADAPFDSHSSVQWLPPPSDAVLEVDGVDIGKTILDEVEPIRTFRRQMADARPIAIPASGSAAWEAEEGLLFPGMTIGQDPDASGGRFVWHPKDETTGSRTGSVTFRLDVAEAGTYFLWGRVLAPDPQSDSFFVLLHDAPTMPSNSSSWHTSHSPQWQWRPVAFDRAKEPARLELPAGRTNLQFRVRETGTKLDQLFLTQQPDQAPE